MKNRIRKMCSCLLAGAMLFAASLGASAADVPQKEDKVAVTVSNVEAGATVTGYQIVQGKYGTGGGLIRYERADGITEAMLRNPEVPTSKEVAAIAGKIISNEVTLDSVSFVGTEGTYSAEIKAGIYVVLVTDTAAGTVYNPMIVSAGYGEDGVLKVGAVNALDNYWINPDSAYAKSTAPTITKRVQNKDGEYVIGRDAALGDVLRFKASTQVPAYSAAYSHITFSITEILENGFEYVGDAKVFLDDEEYSGDELSIESEKNSDGETIIKISLTTNGTRWSKLQELSVVYTATLTTSATTGVVPNISRSVLTYTNDPTETADDPKTAQTDDEAYVYSFGIGAPLGGAAGDKKTHEIIKTTESGSIEVTQVEAGIDTIAVTGALAGATFTMTDTSDATKVFTATSDAEGYITFTGLKAGSYKLVETVAPAGYALDDTVRTVVISSTYGVDGKLTGYEVSIEDQGQGADPANVTSTYTLNYGADGALSSVNSNDATVLLKNLKIRALPSTGGVGTYLITLIGAGLMMLAVALLFLNRREDI